MLIKFDPTQCADTRAITLLVGAYSKLHAAMPTERVLALRTSTEPNVYDVRLFFTDGRLWRAELTLDQVSNPLVALGLGTNNFRSSEHGAIRAFRATLSDLILDNQPLVERIEVKDGLAVE